MSELVENQLSTLRFVAKALDNFKKIGRNNLTSAKIRNRMTSLKETWNNCLEGHRLLLQHYPESKRDLIAYFRDEQLDQYQEIYLTALDYMSDCLEELEPCVSPLQSSDRSVSHIQSESALSLRHLPPIQLPPFSGKADEWETFRDRFTALIIKNPELSDFARMHFLVSSLTDKARDVVAGTSVTADNFDVAWKALTSRFENKRKLVELHIAELYNLPSVNKECAAELHALRDKADRALSALKRLNRTQEDILNDILVYFVSLKLDSATRRAWKLKTGSESTPPNYEDLITFISSRALALEELAPSAANKGRHTVQANTATFARQSSGPCPVCKTPHYLSRCQQFVIKSPNQRREIVKNSNLCFNCLGTKHSVKNCQSKNTCRICQKRHHSLLHLDSASSSDLDVTRANTSSTSATIDNLEPSQTVAMSAVCSSAPVSSVLLATAKVTVRSPDGRVCEARALIDQGSEVTFISARLARILRLPRKRMFAQISAVGGINADTCRQSAVIEFAPRGKPKPVFTTVAYILNALTKYAPRLSVSVSDWRHISTLKLADDDPTGSSPIDVIIGADIYSQIITNGIRKGPIGQPIAQRSHFGWIISGPAQNQNVSAQTINVFHCSIERELRRFWEIEEIPRYNILSPAEEQCEKHFLTTHSRISDGRYVVRLPFKTKFPIDIGESRSIAIRRLTALKRRLDTNPDLKSEYSAFLEEYEQLKHMKRVHPPTASHSPAVYLPHHPVIRTTSATTRLRVVFNASSLTTNGTSLNSHLEIGPKLQTEITAILLRWRKHKYVYMADIAKMYRQILVDPRDRDYQRIVWYNQDQSDIQDYQLSTVTYGTASAPFLALRVIKQLITDEGAAFPLATPILQDDIYVDDVLFGANDISVLRQVREQLCSLLSRGRFTLRKWASNNSALLADIPEECHGLAGNRWLTFEENFSVLGLTWNPAYDTFQFRVDLSPTLPDTKRKILSTIARLFDPLGWVTPVTINAKIFMQHLWRLKLNWDDTIPSQTLQRWESIYYNLSALNNLQIPRWPCQDDSTALCELHGFADASNAAYAAAVYMHTTSQSGEIKITLLAGKSKVAPLKITSLSRLELQAACLLARLIEFTQSSLQMSNVACHCWTDSTVVLAWLNSHPSRWKTFVSHRVADIQSRLPEVQWRYIPSADNPADCASRGILHSDFNAFNLWWHGPPWLKLTQTKWPRDPAPPLEEAPEENRKLIVHVAHTDSGWDLATRYSTWPKLIRITAYTIRFATRFRKKDQTSTDSEVQSQSLTASEFQTERKFWIRSIQADVFSDELDALKKQQALPSKSALAMRTIHRYRVFGNGSPSDN
ncbi:uncharacterized protein LOC105248729 [Camponotus floridanus]|uniref:uncharacterized protein LOC105248729 n=1 Tax=Camponotus floridanus TaxID=104421 RepID=UPI000DC6720D|nr:uncharacterized protein LOC105248729 [Camponotus floridanus]